MENNKLSLIKALKKTKPVAIPNSDEVLIIRELTTSEIIELRDQWAAMEKDTSKKEAFTIIAGCDELKGATADEIIAAFPREFLSTLAAEIIELCGFGEKIKATKKKSV